MALLHLQSLKASTTCVLNRFNKYFKMSFENLKFNKIHFQNHPHKKNVLVLLEIIFECAPMYIYIYIMNFIMVIVST
jgi:hypothetical protein